ncbi:MAG: hypothetical protein GXO19_05930 [Epsilonproteobacteria bacterium]|nr:hypothetical protein [Campylobacterota bacterium]NPA57254.1 hypothetical protein [Campylobacterota bacterium]
MRKYIQKVSSYAMVGGLGALLVLGLSGCEKKEEHQEQNQNSGTFTEAAKKEGAFVIIEEVAPGQYKIAEEYPSSKTRVILRDLNGTERILSQEELDRLVKEEAAKIDANQSPLVNPQIQNNMSLGEVLLASAAGAIIGAWLGNKLFGNPTYQERRQQTYKSPTVFQRSQNSFNRGSTLTRSGTTTTTKSGFFSKTTSTTTTPSKSGTTTTKSFSFGG